ncbi:MAG TPA: STAS domain-containing protein [Micromonosporaceae bacterium]|nr:STAS domain-containing protein [Micromonosporaceae bacterium]
MAFSISTRSENRHATVALAGELDLMTVGQLDTALDAVAAEDVTHIVVNLAELTFTDSVGISALIRGRRLADQRGISYEVVGATDLVRKLLDLTGVWAFLSSPSR